MGVAFIDTETLGLQARTHAIWEIAIIIPDGPDAGEHLWQQSVRSWLERADPVALDINGFHDRYDESSALGWRESTDRFMRLLEGRHLVGAVPSFDEERLRHQVSIYHGEVARMPWHYHLIDVEALAVGYLKSMDDYLGPPALVDKSGALTLPWSSEDLSRALGVDPPEGADRHTALADARWAKAIYERIMGGAMTWMTFRPIETWPGALTTTRKPTPFDASWRSTLETLAREVTHLQGANPRLCHPGPVVVQLAVPEGAIRQDGQLRADRRAPDHPGVILNVETPSGPLRFSCDRFYGDRETVHGWRHNMRAIALGLEALRKVERYGMGSGAEQYVGFQALPPATPMGQAMTVEVALDLLSSEGGMSASGFGEDGWVVKAFRAAAARHHPDRGGDPTMFRRIVEARDLLAAAGP